jgi:hypothetical protein
VEAEPRSTCTRADVDHVSASWLVTRDNESVGEHQIHELARGARRRQIDFSIPGDDEVQPSRDASRDLVVEGRP